MKQDRVNSSEKTDIERSFGEVLRRLRQSSGLSQEALGFKSGYHRTYISLLERGKKSPSLQTIFQLAEAIGTEPSELIKHVQDHISGKDTPSY
jgi:transcriptional regulator with XRE-family HTH domain